MELLAPKARSKTDLVEGDGLLMCGLELLDRARVVAEILLAANQQERHAGAEVANLRHPLSEGKCEVVDCGELREVGSRDIKRKAHA